jgi:carboxymethylenebutenolidase
MKYRFGPEGEFNMRRAVYSVSVILALLSCAAANGQTMPGHDHGSTTLAGASTPSMPHSGRAVTFPSAAGEGSGYLVLPKSEGKHPALVVIQEWWGLNDWIKGNADRFAGQGYVALAVDLYRGKSTTDPAVAHELMRGLPEDRANADLKAAFALLAARPDVDPTRIGSIGWCMGGGYSLSLATTEPRLAACVINYGRLVTDPSTIAKIDARLLGNFGGKDRGIPPEDVKAFDAALKAAGKTSDMKVYDSAGHGFMNPNNAEGYDPAATKDAWQRTDAFLSTALKP